MATKKKKSPGMTITPEQFKMLREARSYATAVDALVAAEDEEGPVGVLTAHITDILDDLIMELGN